MIHLAVKLDGDGLALAEVLVVFRLLRTSELEVSVGQLGDDGRLGVVLGCHGSVDPALAFPVKRLGADLTRSCAVAESSSARASR